MSIVAIVQARMGSTRLPGKVLQTIGGDSMLAQVVKRVRRARLVDQVIVATTSEFADRAIIVECERLAVPTFCGSEEDVLDRYFQTAQTYAAEVVVRITSDCPLIEPQVVDRVIHALIAEQSDYASNSIERTYPRGLDTEAITMATLEYAWNAAREPYQRAHVTPYIYQHPDLFRLTSITSDTNYGAQRWTVDTPEDLAFVRAIYQQFGDLDDFTWQEVLVLLAGQPELAELNRHVEQKVLSQG